MKDLIFAALILGFAVYTLVAFFLNLEPSYGIYGILISMGAEVGYNEWSRRKNDDNKT
jgi:hypothetical protein